VYYKMEFPNGCGGSKEQMWIESWKEWNEKCAVMLEGRNEKDSLHVKARWTWPENCARARR